MQGCQVIKSADEFIALRTSDSKDEYDRAAMDEAPVAVWLDVIRLYPDYRKWVAGHGLGRRCL
jgi:hypothetical protein